MLIIILILIVSVFLQPMLKALVCGVTDVSARILDVGAVLIGDGIGLILVLELMINV